MKGFWIRSMLRWVNLHPLWRRGRTPVWGNRLRAPTFDRWMALQLHRAGLMGAADRRFLQANIKPGMTVVDIGANQGLYTLLFADLVGDTGRVLAFEPDDLLYAALAENVAFSRAQRVRLYQLAVGSEHGTMMLYRSLLNSGDNRLAAKSPAGIPWEAVRVQIERLDVILAGEQIDFVKIDVQGWEMEALRGMQGLLDCRANVGLRIYFEYGPQGLKDAGCEPVQLLEFLKDNGFEIHSLQRGYTTDPIRDLQAFARSVPMAGYQNLFAVRQDQR